MGASLYPPPVATPTVVTSGFTPTSGFTLNNFSGRKFNGVCTVQVYVQVVTALSPAAGTSNFADTTVGTLPAGYRPPVPVNAAWGDGSTSGECVINTDGTIDLRDTNTDQSSPAGRNIRITGTFIL
ncbi:hypothetical protein KGG77_gp60 [Streptomyces phage Omar]|uniref:Uncharacterized protein n=1 Tax=Streptomyces phage Omar TaxID=2059882 RepID=A0A2H5BLJ3_9CAUD|nr:hypothetical protein KGG77_gp60 [Streptomyces phage Omar]AUG87208.1 hypothetical protein SEA_OMAR_24 [Streptomyces phage Omar]